MQNIKTSIIGVGVVGGALLSVLPDSFLYDKYKNIGSIEDVNKGDVIFICVPTPYKKETGFDLTYVEDAISSLKTNIETTYHHPVEGPEDIEKTTTSKIIVIKSSIKPGTTDKLQQKFPQHRILYSPEFLTEKHANDDIKKPSRSIVGYTEKSIKDAGLVLSLLPRAPFERIIPALDAELIKYASNAFLATKIILGNQIYDLCEKMGANYDLVKDGMGTDPRIGLSHLNVFEDGVRGFSGKCLPKDIQTLIQVGNEHDIDLEVFKKVEEINRLLVKGTNKEYE
jgi:UDPglucose 6-dehydrogenase